MTHVIRPDFDETSTPQPSGYEGFTSVFMGNGSPEGVVTADPSAIYLQEDGDVGDQFWQKQSGTGNTGWVLLILPDAVNRTILRTTNGNPFTVTDSATVGTGREFRVLPDSVAGSVTAVLHPGSTGELTIAVDTDGTVTFGIASGGDQKFSFADDIVTTADIDMTGGGVLRLSVGALATGGLQFAGPSSTVGIINASGAVLDFYAGGGPGTPVKAISVGSGQGITQFFYDNSNSLSLTVASNGAVTFNATGSGAGFAFSDAVTFTSGFSTTAPVSLNGITTIGSSGYLAINSTSNRLYYDFPGTLGIAAMVDSQKVLVIGNRGQGIRLRYDDSNDLNIVVSSAGAVTYDASGASAGHTFNDLVTAALGLTVSSGRTLTVTGATVTGLTAASVGAGTFPSGTFNFGGNVNITGTNSLTASGEVRAGSDVGGASNHNSLTNGSDLTTNSSGVGTILFKGTTSRNSSGFVKIYIGTTAYYVPVFSAITA